MKKLSLLLVSVMFAFMANAEIVIDSLTQVASADASHSYYCIDVMPDGSAVLAAVTPGVTLFDPITLAEKKTLTAANTYGGAVAVDDNGAIYDIPVVLSDKAFDVIRWANPDAAATTFVTIPAGMGISNSFRAGYGLDVRINKDGNGFLLIPVPSYFPKADSVAAGASVIYVPVTANVAGTPQHVELSQTNWGTLPKVEIISDTQFWYDGNAKIPQLITIANNEGVISVSSVMSMPTTMTNPKMGTGGNGIADFTFAGQRYAVVATNNHATPSETNGLLSKNLSMLAKMTVAENIALEWVRQMPFGGNGGETNGCGSVDAAAVVKGDTAYIYTAGGSTGNKMTAFAMYNKSTTVTVDVESVALSAKTLALEVGATGNLTATVLPENATNKTVTWTSDNADVATVAGGVVTAVAVGTANIIATAGEKADTCVVTVSASTFVPVTGVTLDQQAISIAMGATANIVATVMPDNATNKTVTWTSDNADVATVAGGVVTAVAVGTANIIATVGELADTCVVTVTSPYDEQFKIEKVFEVAIPTDIAPTADCRAGAGYDGKFYVTHKGKQQIMVFTPEGRDSIIYTDTTHLLGTGIALDAAGNIVVETGFPNAITGFTIMKNDGSQQTYIDLVSADGTNLLAAAAGNGRADLVSVFGDVFSAEGGYVFLYGTGVTKPQYVKVANGAFVEIGNAADVDITTGTTTSKIHYFNPDTKMFFAQVRSNSYQFYTGTELINVTNLPNLYKSVVGGALMEIKNTAGEMQRVYAYPVAPAQYSAEFSMFNFNNGKLLCDANLNTEFYVLDKNTFASNTYDLGMSVQKINDYAYYLYEVIAGKGGVMYKVYSEVPATGVDMDMASVEIDAMDEVQLTATVQPLYATVRDVVWTSDNEEVATVSETGLVTGLTAGQANITATSVDGNFTASCSVKVNNVVFYRLVQAKQLIDGAKMLIVNGDSLTMGTKQNNNFKADAAVSVTDNKIETLNAGTTVITLGVVENGYTFSTKYGYLVAGTSSSNYLKVAEEVNDVAVWTISAAADSTVIVNANPNAERNTIRFNINKGNPLISSYKGETQNAVQIFINQEAVIDALDNVETGKEETLKFFQDGQLYIIRDGKVYNAQGALVE